MEKYIDIIMIFVNMAEYAIEVSWKYILCFLVASTCLYQCVNPCEIQDVNFDELHGIGVQDVPYPFFNVYQGCDGRVSETDSFPKGLNNIASGTFDSLVITPINNSGEWYRFFKVGDINYKIYGTHRTD